MEDWCRTCYLVGFTRTDARQYVRNLGNLWGIVKLRKIRKWVYGIMDLWMAWLLELGWPWDCLGASHVDCSSSVDQSGLGASPDCSSSFDHCGLGASPLVDKEKLLELIKPDLAWVCYCDSRMRTLRVLLRILHLWNNMFFVYYIKMWFWHLYVMHVCTLFLNKN